MTATDQKVVPLRPARSRLQHAERRAQLRKSLRSAEDYSAWSLAAQELDTLSGREAWKARPRSALYDYEMISARLDSLRSLRRANDVQGLMFAIEEGIHGNLGGMGNPVLHNKARFGTKHLVSEFVDEVCAALDLISNDRRKSRAPARMDLFHRASHCYGRSALMMSSGGTLLYFHCGVVKAMLEAGVLPRVISGSSAGSLIASILGTRTDEELKGHFSVDNLTPKQELSPTLLERVSGIRRQYTTEDVEEMVCDMIPDMTFREALEHSGRHISVSVSPCERHHRPRLLNAITSPHVLIRSAVRASCAVPGFFEPVQLLAREADGSVVPYLKQRWIDGIFAADLPARQLARLYGVNHYIVSYINPVLLPMFNDAKLNRSHWGPLRNLVREYAQHWVKSADQTLGKYLPSSSVGTINKVLHDLLSQKFVGDINITPHQKLVSPFKLLSPRSAEEIAVLLREGEQQTWPKIETIRLLTQISRKLDDILVEQDRSRSLLATPHQALAMDY